MDQRKEADEIIRAVLAASRPDAAVAAAVRKLPPCTSGGRTVLLAVGKAACSMAVAALSVTGFAADQAMIITKYGHVDETALALLPETARSSLIIREAGHPVPDENSYRATVEAIAMVQGLTVRDRVILLLSGGGSALFEKPLLPAEEIADINRQLLSSGAEIGGINTIRKRLSAVKGGRFARLCAPAQVITIALSDVLSDAPDQIASGPACADPTTCDDAIRIVEEYGLRLTEKALQLLRQETPKELPNASVQIIGSMRIARRAAAKACAGLGYDTLMFLPPLTCQAQEAGRFLGALARKAHMEGRRLAIVAGGETVVRLPEDHGLGGRNQEAALAAAPMLAGRKGLCFFSLGTDGTDGPTNAAGGIVTGDSFRRLEACAGGLTAASLCRHDAYHALQACNGLLITGPTGTNVNDICVALADPVADDTVRAKHGKNIRNPVSKIDKPFWRCYHSKHQRRK
ncbi:MAG: DUF4147 domain-containing protein [Clostridia bacterium]|nr:DUF4147 domain-containing protein [Clostridia bacterium]